MPYDYRQVVSNNGTLVIRDTAVQDQGTYTCEAKADGFLDSSSFNVVVKSTFCILIGVAFSILNNEHYNTFLLFFA